jgi:SAM-dependent methyltransferase
MDSLLDLQRKWDRTSRWYDFATVALEALLFRRLRSQLLKSAVGRMLEVAAGTGSNLAQYPPGLDIFAVDLSPRMLLKARQRGCGAQKVHAAGRQWPSRWFGRAILNAHELLG